MAVEQSNKRRKLNPAGFIEEPGRQPSQNTTASTPDTITSRKPSSGDSRTALNVSSPPTAKNAGRVPRRSTEQATVIRATDTQRDASEDEEETVVRSSGRVRRPTAKVAQDETLEASRVSTSRTSAHKTKRQSTTLRSEAAEASHGTIQESGKRRDTAKDVSTTSSRKSKENGTVEKENITPTPTPPSTVEPITLPKSSHPDSGSRKRIKDSRQDSANVTAPALLKEAQQLLQQATATDMSTHSTIDLIAEVILTPADLMIVRAELMVRAVGKKCIPLIDRQDELAKVTNLVKQVVEAGESNSMMLIGPRGTGKTALINQVIQTQQEATPNDFHVVRLNGFIHTDDKLALRDVWRQLGREMQLDEAETATRSYADTMSMLLALLSHPLELGQSTRPGQITKSVVFILDEFDLFTTHARQTLLYNLFDIAQSRKAPIAVLGLTTRVDIAEALEKRVKSRFSHRYIHLAPARSLSAFISICKAYLNLASGVGTGGTTIQDWNCVVEALLANEEMLTHIRKIYYRSKSVPDFLTIMQIPLALLPTTTALSTEEITEHFLSTISTSVLGLDSKLDILSSLSTLQMAMLICAARQNAIYATDTVSFNLAYEEYKAIAGKAKLQATAAGALAGGSRVWSKDVAKSAWTDLVEYGFIIDDGRGTGKVDIALEELAESGIELGQWLRWCKEI